MSDTATATTTTDKRKAQHDGRKAGTASGTPYGIVGGFAVEPIAPAMPKRGPFHTLGI